MKPSVASSMKRLTTPFEAGDIPYSSYPRPQLVRDSFLNLNGRWSLSCRKKTAVTAVGEILVPFPPESEVSGIGKTLDADEQWIYERTFTLPDGFCRDRVLLHFGAVDQTTRVFVNG